MNNSDVKITSYLDFGALNQQSIGENTYFRILRNTT